MDRGMVGPPRPSKRGWCFTSHEVLPAAHPRAAANATHLERFVKFLLWSRGGWRLFVDGPPTLVAELAAHYRDTATGRFDASLVASRCSTIRSRSCTRATCRRSAPRRDRSDATSRAAASASTSAAAIARWRRSSTAAWSSARRRCGTRTTSRSAVPLRRHHGFAGEGRRAPPRVDAIGGSAAGVYVNNRVKAGSLFPRRAEEPVRCAREGPVPRGAPRLGRRAVRGGERRRGDRARRLDVARGQRHSRHRARHEHRRRLRHARRQHHLVARRARVRADRLSPWRRDRRVVGRLRRRLAVFLAAVRRPADARGRHRLARRHGAARAAETRCSP